MLRPRNDMMRRAAVHYPSRPNRRLAKQTKERYYELVNTYMK